MPSSELETVWIVYATAPGVEPRRVGTLVGKEYQTIFDQACRLLGLAPESVVIEDSGRKKPRCTTCPGQKKD